MKQFLKKFKEFRLVAFIEAIAGAVGLVAALLILIFYQTNQTRLGLDGNEVIIPGFPGEPIAGMVFFLAGLLAIIFGVVVVYSCIPFIFKKDEKLDPNKLIPWFAVVAAAFSLIEVIFGFVMIGKAGSRNTVGVVIASIFLILALLVQLLMIYPTLRVRLKEDD